MSGALSYGVGNRWPPACCARRDRAQSSSLYPLSQPRDERRAEQSETRRRLADRPVSLKSPIPKNVYASAMGLCKDSMMMQSRKPSNADF